MIDLLKLRTFIYAAENLNFSEAAKRLHLTQSTISHHIKTLEESFGDKLFIRSGNILKLTETGRLLLPWAHKLIHQANQVEELVASRQQRIAGHLRIACSTTAGKYILPQMAARFCQQYPGIQVSILACTPEHIMVRLLEGEANLGVLSSDNLCGDGLECQEFFNDYISLIVPSDHPWALRSSIEPADLLDEKIIIRESTSGTRRVLLTELAKHDITLDDLNVFLELGNAEAIVMTVQEGYAISFVSSLATKSAEAMGRVTAVPVKGLELRRKVYMARPVLDTPHRPQEVFWGFIHDPTNADLLRLPRPV